MADNNGGAERGQLILIGAVAIAFILLGIVVVFNGVQYTETVSNDGAQDDLENVEMIKIETENGIEGLLQRTDNSTELQDVDDEIREWEDVYNTSKAHQSPTYFKIYRIEYGPSSLGPTDTFGSANDVTVHFGVFTDEASVNASVSPNMSKVHDGS